MNALLISLLTAAAYSPRLRFRDRGPSPTYRARLNRAVYSSAGRVTFRCFEMEQARILADRRIRCEVYAENSDIAGRSSQPGPTWARRIAVNHNSDNKDN